MRSFIHNVYLLGSSYRYVQLEKKSLKVLQHFNYQTSKHPNTNFFIALSFQMLLLVTTNSLIHPIKVQNMGVEQSLSRLCPRKKKERRMNRTGKMSLSNCLTHFRELQTFELLTFLLQLRFAPLSSSCSLEEWKPVQNQQP